MSLLPNPLILQRLPPLTVAIALHQATQKIDRTDAQWLLVHALEKEISWLFSHSDELLTEQSTTTFENLLNRRINGEPIAYLIGKRGFWTLNLNVSPATLIPRPETELLVEQALALLPLDSKAQIADLGTGSGAIALSLASERPGLHIVATDISKEALAIAQRNAQQHRITNVEFLHGAWFNPLAGQQFELIISNPPYIAANDHHLQQGDLRFEPASALASGSDGLQDIRKIVAEAGAFLHPEGWLLLEHGWDQGQAVRELFQQAGFLHIQTYQDIEQRDRITFGQWFNL